MLRFFGQGSLMLVSRTTINLWFVRLRGTVMGVAGAVVCERLLIVAVCHVLPPTSTLIILFIHTSTQSSSCHARGLPRRPPHVGWLCRLEGGVRQPLPRGGVIYGTVGIFPLS